MTVEYLDLGDYLAIAAAVTGLDATTLTRVTRLSLADSALHAPEAGFGGVELYPDFIDKAAVLLVRLARNHPLPDGNKRAAWVSMRMFVEVNGWRWTTSPGHRRSRGDRRRHRRRDARRGRDGDMAARVPRAARLGLTARSLRSGRSDVRPARWWRTECSITLACAPREPAIDERQCERDLRERSDHVRLARIDHG